MTMPTRRIIVPVAAAALSLLLSKNLLSSPLPPDSLDAAPSRFATSEGVKVHYKSLGDASSKTGVVFIHGFAGDMTAWRAQASAFDGKARMLFVDLPGHGKSDRPAVDYTMDRFAAAVDAVMRDAGVERALLVGHSMGTPVARPFWRKHPAKTLGIAAVDGALRTYFKDPAQVDAFVARFSGPDYEKTMAGFFESTFTPATPEAVRADVRKMAAGFTQPVAASAMRGMFDLAIWTDDPIKAPLLVLVAKGPMWSADYFAYARTLNPDATIVEVPGAGHFVMMEKPAEVNAALVAFAARAGAIPMRALRPGRPEDVSSPEALVKAVYDTISGAAGQKRDWDRFRSLFADGARLIPSGQRPAGDFGPRVLDPEGYVRRSEPIFETTSFFEREVARRVERFGHIVQVFSTYEARHDPKDAAPFVRGINSFQLLFDGTRWWAVTIFWEAESETVRIPKEYLP
jgi:pimeloyl-ACP methyl ester carboxylesterase